MEVKTRVIKGQYHDSVSLMLAAREMKKVAGVADAAVVMGTDANKGLLKQAGLLTREAQAALADDLVISIKKDKDAEAVLAQVDEFLVKKPTQGASESGKQAKTLRGLVKADDALNFIEISIAGAFAAKEAREALASGLHVLLFSDNVSLEDEIDLKRYAVSKGLLLMGPGAGTAYINGVGMGFANALPKGPVGIVSAAGTGLQEVSTILAWADVGVSQAIGTGGRDLTKAVGGLMTTASIQALIEDDETELIILISKPADADVTSKILDILKKGKKPSVVCMLGAKVATDEDANIHFTSTLEACAMTAIKLTGVVVPEYDSYLKKDLVALETQAKKIRSSMGDGQKYIRGLYSGGTLCYEAQVIWREMLDATVYSNAPLEKRNFLENNFDLARHTTLDLGEEEFTVGRPHPMIDNDLRVRYIEAAGKESTTAVIVMDVVIGYGAHADPAEELGDAIQSVIGDAKKEGRVLAVVTCVTGTKNDPQSLKNTKEKLKASGAIVCNTNAQATRLTALIVAGRQAVK